MSLSLIYNHIITMNCYLVFLRMLFLIFTFFYNEKKNYDNSSTSDSEPEPIVPLKKIKKNSNYISCDYKVGDYVIIEYENESYAGIEQ